MAQQTAATDHVSIRYFSPQTFHSLAFGLTALAECMQTWLVACHAVSHYAQCTVAAKHVNIHYFTLQMLRSGQKTLQIVQECLASQQFSQQPCSSETPQLPTCHLGWSPVYSVSMSLKYWPVSYRKSQCCKRNSS